MTVQTFADRALVAIASDRAEERAQTLAGYVKDGIDLVVGEQVTGFAHTRSLLATTTPDEWAQASDFLIELLDREPLVSQSTYSAMRQLIYGFSIELYSYARSAGYDDATA